MFIVTEKAGKGRVRAARTPLFSSKVDAEAYITQCPNSFSWGWQAKELRS